ncbi:ATP-dependent DNA ligase [Mesorhizobium sp. 128a]
MRLKFIPPMEPELFDAPPVADGWSHEIKFDGYRTQVISDEDGIRFYTKNGFDWTARYRYLAEEAAAIDAQSFILEGEAIMIDKAGLSNFHALQAIIGLRRPSPNIYLVSFDLLFLNGHDLRRMPLEDRREILQQLVPTGGRIQFSEAMPGTGDAVYPWSTRLGSKAWSRSSRALHTKAVKRPPGAKSNASRKSRWTSLGCNASAAKRRK